jgi:transketolase
MRILIVLYADNHIAIEGSTGLAFTEDRYGAVRGSRLAGAESGA